MTGIYNKIFHPSREQIIEGYEKQIKRKEEEIKEIRAHVLKLKGQATLMGSNER